MVVAAAAALLVWFDATGQLRPLLTTTPEVVFELTPAPVTASIAALPNPDTDLEAAGAEGDWADDIAGTATPSEELPADETSSTGVSADHASNEATETDPVTDTAPADAADETTAENTASTDDSTTDSVDISSGEAEAVPETGASDGADAPSIVQSAALPSLSRDPNLPWRLYAAPFADGDPRPRIAIVFTTLGLSDGATEAIVQQMPGAVTLAFSPYSRKLGDWIARARAKGHEVLVELPMEPLNYPEDDPGPLALLSDRPMEDNITRLIGILDRAEGSVGVAAYMGSRFTSSEELLQPVLAELAERGYVYVDNATAPMSAVPSLAQRIAAPIVVNDHFLDTEASRIAIDGRLQQIERIARSEGAAVAFASPYPITIERLLAWIPTLEAKGFVLVPVTATVGQQTLP